MPTLCTLRLVYGRLYMMTKIGHKFDINDAQLCLPYKPDYRTITTNLVGIKLWIQCI